MRTTEDFLLSARKDSDHTNFACFVKNITPQAIMVPVAFGQMEEYPQIDDEQYDRLIEKNRARYCVAADLTDQAAVAATPKPKGEGGFELGDPELL